MHQVRDGYEIKDGDNTQIILAPKGSELSDKEVIELAREHLGIGIADTATVRKLSEIEVAKYKKEVINEINEKGN